MRTETHDPRKLQKEYTALATTYDKRWAAYLRDSLRMTLDMAVELEATSILDVACGTGLLLESFSKRSNEPKLSGIDTVPAMLSIAKKRVGQQATLVEGNAEKLPFDDNAFQLVVSSNALHYFADAELALHEMRRVISPAGNLIITDWCRDYLWMKLLNRALPWTRHAHTRTLNMAELEQVLVHANFKMVRAKKEKIDWFWGLMTVHAVPN